MEALGVGGAAAEAVIGALVDGGVPVHGSGGVAVGVGGFGVALGFGHGVARPIGR